MPRYIFLSFFFMGWAFYEMSGGSDFASDLKERRELAAAEAKAEEQTKAERYQALVNTDRPKQTVHSGMVTRASYSPTSPITATPADTQKEVLNASSTSVEVEPKADDADINNDDPAIQTIEAAPLPDIRAVSGTRVNVRMGPATSYNVVLRLTKGTRVRILQEPGNGWVKLKVEDSGRVGWMASRLLTKLEG